MSISKNKIIYKLSAAHTMIGVCMDQQKMTIDEMTPGITISENGIIDNQTVTKTTIIISISLQRIREGYNRLDDVVKFSYDIDKSSNCSLLGIIPFRTTKHTVYHQKHKTIIEKQKKIIDFYMQFLENYLKQDPDMIRKDINDTTLFFLLKSTISLYKHINTYVILICDYCDQVL